MSHRPNVFKAAVVLSLSGALLLSGVAARAADLDTSVQPAPLVEGADCAAAPTLPWQSVWLGHFSGGTSSYDQQIGRIALTWVDQKLCFPSAEACNAWIAPLRSAYHRPESYWTCLLLR